VPPVPPRLQRGAYKTINLHPTYWKTNRLDLKDFIAGNRNPESENHFFPLTSGLIFTKKIAERE